MVRIPPAPNCRPPLPEIAWYKGSIRCEFNTYYEKYFSLLVSECLNSGYSATINNLRTPHRKRFVCKPVSEQYAAIFQQRLEELIFGEVQNREVVEMKIVDSFPKP